MKFVQTMRILAAFDSFLLVSKIFDWMSLIETTAFYMSLLAATLMKIRPFMIIFVAALFLFGLPISMLNLNRNRYNEDE